jgi:hypothetical protein
MRSNHHKLNIDEDSLGVQFCFAPSHINARSNSLPSNEPYLPAEPIRGHEYTLVLDLDETLVHFDPVSLSILTFYLENSHIQAKTSCSKVPE